MMHFSPIPEPDYFEKKVRKPGKKWLKKHPGAKKGFPDHWKHCMNDLRKAFNCLCAYSVIRDLVGTVDHFLSKDKNGHLAYEWNNFRYSSGWINSSKKNIDSEILDPFEVNDDWFEIILPSLQLVVSDKIPNNVKEKAEFTITRLNLRDGEKVIQQRQVWYEEYKNGEINLDFLRKVAPLIAKAAEKENQLQDNSNR